MKKQSFEEKMLRLEQIAAALEKGDAALEESLKLFEEGTKLIAECGRQIDAAQQKVVKLTRGAEDAPQEEPFVGSEE